MGVGKSHVGRLLAKKCGLPYLDADAEIEERSGMKIAEIFSRYGEERFRDMETELLKGLSEGSGAVVSCGGGMVLREENRRVMQESGTVVYLTAQPETIFERVRYSSHRPLLNGRMNPEAIGALMEERRERYENAAEITIATDARSGEEIAEELQRILFPSSQTDGVLA